MRPSKPPRLHAALFLPILLAACGAPPGPAAVSPVPATAVPAPERPEVAFVDLPARLDSGICTRVILTLIQGDLAVMAEKLAPGDSVVLTHATEQQIEGNGLALVARARIPGCAPKARPSPEKQVIRAATAPALRWAQGAMEAHLDTPREASPELYSGRLAGTASVAEHNHEGSWEILAAVEASGTFTLDGQEQRLGPKQVVFIPPGARHSWKPDAGAKLVAVQMYAPPGPEQRFVTLAQKEAPR